jgi:hypothetical protein
MLHLKVTGLCFSSVYFRGSISDILARKGYTQVKSIGGIASYRGKIVSGK